MRQRALLDNAEAAAFLGVRAGTLAVWRCTGRYLIPFIKIGRSPFYRKKDLENFLADRPLMLRKDGEEHGRANDSNLSFGERVDVLEQQTAMLLGELLESPATPVSAIIWEAEACRIQSFFKLLRTLGALTMKSKS